MRPAWAHSCGWKSRRKLITTNEVKRNCMRVWDAAHAFIERRKQAPREYRAKHPVLLAGLLFAPDGQRMLHSFVKKKNGRQCRYYVP